MMMMMMTVFKDNSAVWYPGQKNRMESLPFLQGCHKSEGPTALTPEIDCDQTAMGLPAVMSAVFLLDKSFW
jgi:hypothetical protein